MINATEGLDTADGEFISPFDLNGNQEEWKNSLINNLFSTVECLKSELIEKNKFIDRLLTLHEQDIVTLNEFRNSSDTISNNSVSTELNTSFNQFSFDNVTMRRKHKTNNTESVTSEAICNIPLTDQLLLIRAMQHKKFTDAAKDNDMSINYGESNLPPNIDDYDDENSRKQYICSPPKPPHHSKKKAWNQNTLLIVGDSILNGVQEGKMSSNGSIKVRSFPGAVINDFYNYLEPLMEKKPDKLIVHVGSNDAFDKTAEVIFNDLVQLKSYIKQRFCIDAVISCPTIRTDNSRAKKVVAELREYLNKLEGTVICNDNITDECLGKGGKHPGLHLNPKGSGRLALNFISYNRRH